MWKNLTNDKCYIGSAVNLYNRLSSYHSTTYMEYALTRGNSHIYRALLKNGYSNFSLTIIEYCEPEKCIEREDYYLCSLPHEYNILPKAGSLLGHKHSDETKTIMSDNNKGSARREQARLRCAAGENNPMFGITGENHPRFGKNHSDETKKIISDAMTGEKNPMYNKPRPVRSWDIFNSEYNIAKNPIAPFSGRKHSDESKLIMSDVAKKSENTGRFTTGQERLEGAGRPYKQIEVFDNKNNTITSYDSMSEAARALNINKSVINLYFTRNQQKPYKGQYTFKKL